jgi:predicted SAM-dependent methyltransferase
MATLSDHLRKLRHHLPVLRRFYALRQEVVALRQEVAAIGHERSHLRNAMERISARLDDMDAASQALRERIEFVRVEILFEMAHGKRSEAPQDTPSKTIARILVPERVAAARAKGALRINLGCGHIPLRDYLNVDMRDLPGVDIMADADDLPFDMGSVDEVFSAHLLEHFPQEALRRRLLPYWHGLLRPGGIFRAVTPDAAAMLAGAGAGTYGFEDFREVVFGTQDYVGDYHYNLFTPDSLRQLLEEAGFRQVTVPVSGRRNGRCFEFEISAERA